MNSNFNVEKLHMNSKGEPALHKTGHVTQTSHTSLCDTEPGKGGPQNSPGNYCCQYGSFGDGHRCAKQPSKPAKCEPYKMDELRAMGCPDSLLMQYAVGWTREEQDRMLKPAPAAIPNGDNGGAKMPPLRRMQFDGHEYVHLQEVLESVDALKGERDRLKCEGEALKTERTTSRGAELMKGLIEERDRWKAMAEKLAGALEHYKHLAMPKDKISAIVETYPFAAVALAEYKAAVERS